MIQNILLHPDAFAYKNKSKHKKREKKVYTTMYTNTYDDMLSWYL